MQFPKWLLEDRAMQVLAKSSESWLKNKKELFLNPVLQSLEGKEKNK